MPNARIALVIRPALVNLVELCPHIDNVIPFAPKFGFRPERLKALFGLRRQVAAALGAEPELGILPRFDADFSRGLIALLATGAQRRIGFSESATPEKAHADASTDRFLTHPIKPECTDMHELKRNLSLLEALGAQITDDHLELWLSPEDRRKAREVMGGCPQVKQWIAVCVGASTARKRWPLDRYAALIKSLAERHREYGFVFIGGTDEFGVAKALADAWPRQCVNAAGRLTLRETSALLELCRLYVGNDTGPMHLAAAVGTPVVAVYSDCLSASSADEAPLPRFAPWGVKQKLLLPWASPPCREYCTRTEAHCILNTTTSSVADAVGQLLTDPALAAANRPQAFCNLQSPARGNP